MYRKRRPSGYAQKRLPHMLMCDKKARFMLKIFCSSQGNFLWLEHFFFYKLEIFE